MRTAQFKRRLALFHEEGLTCNYMPTIVRCSSAKIAHIVSMLLEMGGGISWGCIGGALSHCRQVSA